MAGPTYNVHGALLSDRMADQVASYSHEIRADGGWWSAAISFAASENDIEEWFGYGLNRHIEVYNAAFELVWVGFVNQITVQAGTLTAVRGPLIDIVNRVSVVYTPILDPTTLPPIEGVERPTTIANDVVSQAAYGVFEAVISGGKLLDDGTTDNAVYLRDTYLAENANPQTSESLDLGSGEERTMQLDLLGYVHRLDRYVYQDLTTATVQLDTQIQNVLAADPNGLFSTDYTQIAANPTLVSRYTDDNKMALDVLRGMVILGDATGSRYTLGVYEDQRVVYAAVSTIPFYQHAIMSNDLQMTLYGSQASVAPWDVRPARWAFLVDFLPGHGRPAALRDDPRFLFIETVHYTAPNNLQVDGQKISRIPQLLARLSE